MNAFYLVQRMESRDSTQPGFDGLFSLDYMGSSEFEWGAIPKALKAMREREVVARGVDVTIEGRTRTVYFVAHVETIGGAATAMEQWASGDERRPPFWGKEYSEFPDAFAEVPDRYRSTNAWWAIDSDLAWTLESAIADRLLRAFNTKTPAKVS